MLQARFIYRNHLIGEWADITPETIIRPSAEFRGQVDHVQFRDSEGPLPPGRRASRMRERNASHDTGGNALRKDGA
jgi:hypothetical protein